MDRSVETNNSEKRISDFVEAAAHDLHAPLRKLSVLVDRFFSKQRKDLKPEATEYIKRIDHCIREMQSLINGLAELAQSENPEGQAVAIDLTVVVKEVVSSLEEEMYKGGGSFNTGSLPTVKGNPTQCRQLFKNLLENAVKFAGEKAPARVEITAAYLSDAEKDSLHLGANKRYHKIEIRDHGIGFEQGYAEKIFEPFVRLNPKSRYEGNGLGLSICRKIVTNLHGIIYAHSAPGMGARFILILPETLNH